MGEISKAGYADLQTFIQQNWTHFAVRNGDTELLRLPTDGSGDPPVTLTSEEGKLAYRVVVEGRHVMPTEATKVRADGSALFPQAGDERAIETFPAVEFQHPQDKLTITHNINTPGGGLGMDPKPISADATITPKEAEGTYYYSYGSSSFTITLSNEDWPIGTSFRVANLYAGSAPTITIEFPPNHQVRRSNAQGNAIGPQDVIRLASGRWALITRIGDVFFSALTNY